MKPKIVLLSAFLTPLRSGAEACVEEIPVILKDQFDFTIITARMHRNLPKKDELNGTPVIRVGFGCIFDKWLFPFLAPKAVKKIKPDLVHAVLESFAGLAMVRCKRFKRLLTCQSTNTSLFLKKMHKVADRITVISSTLKERAEKFGRKDTVLIPNGLHLKEIPIIQKVPGRILYVGRLEQMKGIDTLLQAFAQIEDDCHLHIVGDGSQRTKLEKRARTLGITDRVTFLGRVPPPEVYDEYAKAEIFCGLSRSEALGNVFLEAQAAGCGVIGTSVGGIPDIINDGQTGLLVSPDSAQEAADAIRKFLSDPSLRQHLSEGGQANAAKYDWSQIAEQYLRVYEEILGLSS